VGVTRARPRLYVEFEGVGRIPAVSFFSSWGRNEIPVAGCGFAVGRQAANGTTPASTHTLLHKLDRQTPVRVFLDVTGDWSATEGWPVGEYLIFEGRYSGPGLQKSRGTIQATARFEHWLGDLNYSSALSSISHPNNPSQMTYRATISQRFSGAITGEVRQPAGLFHTALSGFVTTGNVAQDLWANCIKPMLCYLARQKHVKLASDLVSCFGLSAGDNTQALTALRKMEGPGADSGLDYSCYAAPLSLSLGQEAPTAIVRAIVSAIMNSQADSFCYNTMWGKLIEGFASQFMFSIIPLVNRAIVVPFVPGLRSTYCKAISNNDITGIHMNGQPKRPIRGVGLWLQQHTVAAPVTGQKDQATLLATGGCWAPANPPLGGMIHMVAAPPWMHGVTLENHRGGATSGIANNRPSSTATQPIPEKDETLIGNGEGVSAEDVLLSTNDMASRYAHSYYVEEVLRGCIGEVSGRLRFDIAPGSTVRIEGHAERFIGSDVDKLSQSIIGDVARVNILIEAETPRAMTAFQIANYRTEAENEDDRYSIENHPLYTTVFTGAPLVDELQFPTDECC